MTKLSRSIIFFSRINGWFDNKENITFVWLTRTSFDRENYDGIITLNGLKQISSYVLIYSEPSDALTYINTVKCERIFLIVDGRLFASIDEIARLHETVDSIYIFCRRRERYEPSSQHRKFKGNFAYFTEKMLNILFRNTYRTRFSF